MDILDGEVNCVTNELNFLGAILNGIELLEINFREADLLDGSLLLRLVLSGTASRHCRERSLVVDNRLLGSLSSTLSTLTVVSLTASTSGVTSSTILLVLATTSSTSLVVSSALVSVLSLSLVHVTVLLLHTTEALHHSVLLFGSLVFAVSEPIEHLSLLAGVLLILKFLLGYPEVNTDRSVAEGSILIKAFNCVFGVINILVENKSLLV